MSYRYERYRERPRSGLKGWLVALTVLIWVLVLGCVAVRFLLRPALTDYVKRQIAVSIDPDIPADINPGQALRESLQQVPLPDEIPVGTLTVSEEQANSYLARYREDLAEIDDLRVRLVPGEVQAQVTMRGFSGVARTEPVAQAGRLVATNTALSQPLSSFISIEPLMQALLDRINDEVAAQGRSITAVQIEQGAAVITIE
ncbi:MAG: hypothetical protein M3P51_04430 [Chloroflexota bacterium]|nr:hypothetical protein [Chloroflexota bacterium]